MPELTGPQRSSSEPSRTAHPLGVSLTGIEPVRVVPETLRPAPVVPTVPKASSENGTTSDRPGVSAGETRSNGRGKLVWVGLGVLALATAFFAIRGPQPSWDGPQGGKNWTAVDELTQKYKIGEVSDQAMVRMKAGHPPEIVTSIGLTEADVDAKATSGARSAANQNDLAGLQSAVQSAQPPESAVHNAVKKAMMLGHPDANAKMHQVPAGQEPQPVKPQISQGLADSVRTGDTKFFHVFLYDNCVDDGDIVRIEINGQPFAMVPLTRQGTTLSIPANSGTAFDVRLVGIRDGGGGITVACHTSNEAYFGRAMMPGESVPLTFVPAGKQ